MHPSLSLVDMIRDLEENGLDAQQGPRYEAAFAAAKIAAVAVMCARYGVGEVEMLEALMDSRNLGSEIGLLVARMEVSPAFVGHVHSGLLF
ncbi:hypothetical protein RA210_U240034 [Rubrivivax sp. A210]|uniref:hypothetical protein n=1 Tax=Rubrivivax sp. A210 TaxID=2772301 RepID=UPI001919F351|nr:hypothetical protein [Rubrivivax sp. A210]CAD5372887.1 hypothetical protein RA210_U240034 [Rubrivivax sp. A210]